MGTEIILFLGIVVPTMFCRPLVSEVGFTFKKICYVYLVQSACGLPT